MEEEGALADAPQGSGAELVWPGGALGDAVGEALAHVMDEEVGVNSIAPTKVKGLLNGAKVLAITLGADDVKGRVVAWRRSRQVAGQN